MSVAEKLATELRRRGISDVLGDSTTIAAYSSDAGLYRVPPLVVVRPRHRDEVATALEVCRELGVPMTSRGGGTSLCGNAVGTGVIVDFSRHMTKVLEIDPESATATVEAGVVQSELQKVAKPHGLLFGPDPSSFTRCTIGGMIGNNACGTRTLGYGKTVDNVVSMRVLTAHGEEMVLHSPVASSTQTADSGTLARLNKVAHSDLSTIRTEFGRFGRQVSGYALEHLLPEKKFDVARMMVGTEGTLTVVTEATVQLATEPKVKILVVLGYPDIGTAGDATPSLLRFDLTACEGIDKRIVDVVRERRGMHAVPPLPNGAAWLFVEVVGQSREEARAKAEELADNSGAVDTLIEENPLTAAALWRIRADGAGLSARSPAGKPAHAGWEDAAVPPQMLGSYLRDLDDLMAEYGCTGIPYGHFGDGCMHIRIDLPLDKPDGQKVYRNFVIAGAQLIKQYGGSLSGEHGDGRARSELLPYMYSPAAISLFQQVKRVFDPDNLLNPGVMVNPAAVDADLRIPAAPPLRKNLMFGYHGDGGDFTQAVHRCTGVGKCRADNSGAGGVMCPSYLATREEKDSTRGRARVLQEMLNGTAVNKGWASPEVHEALDLCLSCKGCASDCPTGVDMAMYKAEVLHQTYKNKVRPPSHYSLGWLPRWSKLAAISPKLVNTTTKIGGSLALKAAGADPRRNIPPFAPVTFRSWFTRTQNDRRDSGDPVVLFVDSFTNYFTPEVGVATVKVLEAAGLRPQLTDRQQCCGLTWISTGQLDAASRILGRTVRELTPFTGQGVPVVGMEPSCTGVFRSDAGELLGESAARPVAENFFTLAELLADRGWVPPSLEGTKVVAQPHCHHHAVMGWSADAALLANAGATVERLGGCCGLAGNFGVEQGHYEVSVKVAEHQLLPAVRAASEDTVILADGFSCRTQLHDLAPRDGHHLAELLAAVLD
ncbi:FAD-binding protein [Hoyosella rhizosphaerae]|uniref:Oxidoreductase n=1 Tax=Hoyosella rhizosphaerae TaxID=1755582 RepID=A0A916XAM1_9ACTN|nr:FAD-binding and (Fe-S)-binding domain-containing protein [Hoyosella rhizosphaerae]MBN4926655.1 FAD-binding protein [Hoyosella rhizosphaerae]GGC57524.1 oxidoreductase [Hoyosella rhizosphaerae]